MQNYGSDMGHYGSITGPYGKTLQFWKSSGVIKPYVQSFKTTDLTDSSKFWAMIKTIKYFWYVSKFGTLLIYEL